MKSIRIPVLAIGLIMSAWTHAAAQQDASKLTDVDGNEYETVRIGDQIWMAENLRTGRYADSTLIPNVTDGGKWSDLTTGAWSSYDHEAANEILYGKLYNWHAVADSAGLCPDGWRVSAYEDWNVLSAHLGGDQRAGGLLKSTDSLLWEGENAGAVDSVGFSARPGGLRRWYGGEFDAIGRGAYFWTSEGLESSRARQIELHTLTPSLRSIAFARFIGASVRCVFSGGYDYPEARLDVGEPDRDGSVVADVRVDRLTQSDSVTAYSFHLELPAGTRVDSLFAGGTRSDTPDHTLTAGRAPCGLDVQWHSSTALDAAGELPLLRIHLTLPVMPIDSDGVPAGFQPFRLNGIRLAGADTLPRLLGPPLLGDVNGDARILAHDASMVLQAVVGSDPLPSLDPLPWSDRRTAAADVDGNNLLQAMDASWMLQHVVGSLAQWPALEPPSSDSATAEPSDAVPSVQVGISGDTLRFTAPEGGVWAFQAQLVHPEGMEAMDPARFPADALAAYKPTEQGGSLAVASSTPLEGVLAEIPLRLTAAGESAQSGSAQSGTGQEDTDSGAWRIALSLTINQHIQTHTLDWTPSRTAVSTEDLSGSDLPNRYGLRQNHPNPFNPSTQIVFDLPEAAPVSLDVFDAAGRRVAVLARGIHPAGTHAVSFDARDLANGLYIYRLATPAFTASRTMILLK